MRDPREDQRQVRELVTRLVERYDRKYRLARLMKTAPVSRERILDDIGERVLGLPRSY